MPFPKTIPDFRAALLAYEPSETEADAIYAAQAHASPVVASVQTFTILKESSELSQSGISLLLGAAFLIASGAWHGLGEEAAALLTARVSELAE